MWHVETPGYSQPVQRQPRRRNEGPGATGEPAIPKDRLFKAGMILLAVLLAAALILGVLDWGLKTANFPVKSVRFEGEFTHVTQRELEDAVLGGVRGNILTVDLEGLKARVEALPWVYRASVRRNWQRDIAIRFTEQRLIMRWGDGAWLNHAGERVRIAPEDAPGGLPMLTGPEGTHRQVLDRYAGLNRILAPVGLSIDTLQLSARRTWRLQLGNGQTLILGRDHPEAKVARFVSAYQELLESHAGEIRQVDLRYTNGFSVKWNHPRRQGPARAL